MTAPSQDGETHLDSYTDEDPSAAMNPWSETPVNGHQTPARARVITHRLSFDGATGIIALPEDAQWMMEDAETDSDEDYGTTPSPTNASEADVAADLTMEASGSSPGTTHTSPKKTRHGTYFHHPERRRQTIPGAFPRS